jgi:predicted O-methyltransferase YrrM
MSAVPRDPFSVKKLSKSNPLRLGYVALSRTQEIVSRARFNKLALPIKEFNSIPSVVTFDTSATAVTERQMAHLLAAVKCTEQLGNSAVVEIGSFRGETTRCLAQTTARTVFAVDPFAGYGGAAYDCEKFKARVTGLGNVIHLRSTSGSAARTWNAGPISLVFIDAVHDYVNVRFDILVWSQFLAGGGIIAVHDTDEKRFAGARRAVFEAAQRLELWAHPPGMVLLRVPVTSA